MAATSEELENVCEIADPLAGKRLTKRICKFLGKVSQEDHKTLKKGIMAVAKGIRKGQKGMMIIAGDISPIELVCHFPIICEEQGLPYIYVPSKAELGKAVGSKRPISILMVVLGPTSKLKSKYDSIVKEIKEIVPRYLQQSLNM
eukprot:TRINITY_DN5773_c0_g1_i1.p1 TRINITY_DN5773_c0_g1~~TRINITY_DN5773_c0_g1_i1.p1  ORF type:complete len:145 (-),score=29.36 TRINITY_DN5773_c0_g1_i1:47-481(-)